MKTIGAVLALICLMGCSRGKNFLGESLVQYPVKCVFDNEPRPGDWVFVSELRTGDCHAANPDEHNGSIGFVSADAVIPPSTSGEWYMDFTRQEFVGPR